jgi:hypothetical protein
MWAVAERNGDASATSSTAERRGGIWAVARDIWAHASGETSRSSSRIASSGCSAWRRIAYAIPPASVAGARRGPAGIGANP